LVDIPNTGSNLLVSFLTASNSDSYETVVNDSGQETLYITASRHSTGIYKAKFAYSGSSSDLYDTWRFAKDNADTNFENLVTNQRMKILAQTGENFNKVNSYVLSMPNLKPSYDKNDKVTFRINARNRNRNLNVYSSVVKSVKSSPLQEAFFKIVRVTDNYEIVGYSTASNPSFSRLSRDVSGSYFDLDMSILQPNYLYEVSFLIKQNQNYLEQKEKFKFRVD